jgi:hypothetical protein
LHRQRACLLDADLRTSSDRTNEELPVADKSPKKASNKKPGKSLKEKRADKQAKKNEKRPGL